MDKVIVKLLLMGGQPLGGVLSLYPALALLIERAHALAQ
ncbi:hypothetical protein ZBT109_0877 [Zymobacter palmae]|uniref:Uncharacterized protein n=1 Tax=Zymobacter palmae TaxID=33074 RepID=A0A348HDE8_9GAMM|nr:hypothetical protein ZBT109_0877 [Zymobacter palmae]